MFLAEAFFIVQAGFAIRLQRLAIFPYFGNARSLTLFNLEEMSRDEDEKN